MRASIFGFLTNKYFLLVNLGLILNLIIFHGPLGFFWGFFSVIVCFWTSGWNWSFLGLSNPDWKRSIIHSLGWAVGIFLFVDVLIQPLIENFFGKIDLSGFDSMKGNLVAYLIYVLIVWTVAAIGEEVVFRGYIQKQIAEKLGDSNSSWIIAALISSILFGLAHLYQGYSGVISTGLIGFMLALVFSFNRQTLTLTMFVHGFYDMIGLTLLYLDLERVLVDPVTRFFFG